MIESTGANVVMDNILVGSRPYFADVELTDDHLDGLAHRYLVDLKHPRTFVATPVDSTKKIYLEDLENRFHYVKDYAEEWNANGVVLETMRYCDVYGYDVPALRDYLDNVGLPNTHIEWDYSEAALAPLRTRIQAFVEVVG
jgi:benzoyl-CoA reductase/2-hydroxyglutaryl-CoA dehydratase subunit BcrC/BadD/HgdB